MLNSKYSEYANQIKQLNSLKKEAVVCEPSFLGVPQPSLEVTTKSGYDATVRFKAAIGSAGEHYRVGLIELRLPGSFTAEQVEKLHEEKAREFGFNKKGAKFSGALGFRSDAKIQLEGAPSPVALSLVSHYIAGNLMITISHSTIFDRKLFAQQSGCLKVIPRI